jgi:carbamoyltransferase
LGLFYSAITAYLGFEVNEGEYKVMGMASYGRPCYKDKIRQLYQPDSIGLPKLNDDYFNFFSGERFPFTPALSTLMGPPREPECPFDPEHDPESIRFADIAASLQAVTEDIYLELCRISLQKTSAPALCLAGGVALNSKANMRLQQALDVPLFVQPAAGDAGGALGAALNHYHSSSPKRRIPSQFNPFLGKAYSSEEILKAIHQADIVEYKTFKNDADLLTTVATFLAQGKVVGWLNGRSEWGPRSLGARSILADPRNAAMKETVNSRIKFRELFRPFAPSVLAEHAGEYFSSPEQPSKAGPEDFMLSVATAKPIAQEKIPAVVHVDGTSRLQTVRSETNPRFHALISAFQALTGIPALLNTSFNRRGEPIVDSPEDAINTFLWTDIDILVMENVLLDKQTL